MKKTVIIFLCFLLIGCSAAAARQIRLVDMQQNPAPYERIKAILKRIPPIDLMTQQYRFGIADNESPNAFVSSKNKMLIVHKGLIDIMDDEELMMIIFHENAHIKYNHAGKNMASSYATTAAFMIANVFVPGVGYANHIVNPLVTTAYSREQELEADRDAVEIGGRISVPPEKYISALNKLKQYAIDHNIRDTDRTGLFDTHPNIEYRINIIKEMAGK